MESIDTGNQQSGKQVAIKVLTRGPSNLENRLQCVFLREKNVSGENREKYHKSKAHLFQNLVQIVLQPTKKSTSSQLPTSCSTEDRGAVEAGEEGGQVRQLPQAGGAVAGPEETRG